MCARILLPGLLALLIAGCNSTQDPIQQKTEFPEILVHQKERAAETNRYLWGYWTIEVSGDSVEVIPDRSAELHFNTVRLLELEPCSVCLRLENLQFLSPYELIVDFRLQHPFPGLLKYTGFDVRGIFIGDEDYTFPASGRQIPYGYQVPRILNPDGYTGLFNPIDYPEGSGAFPALAYIKGKYALGSGLTANLNPYVAYSQDNPRRMFYPGSAEARTVHVFKPSGNLKFGYAVDASWVYTDNVVDPLTDFSLAANSIEAYKIVPDKINGYQISAANPTDIKVEIFDHQGLETIDGVTIESPLLFNGEKSLEYESETPEGGWIFSGSFSNDLHAITGIYPVLIRVRDTWTDDNLGKVDAWQVVDSYINTTPNSGGWAISWGSELRDRGTAICLDSEQNIYVSGYRTIFGERSALVTKVNQQGVILWERVWRTHGIQYEEQTHGSWMVKSDGADGIYVAGIFLGETDFDPGPDLDLHNSNGEKDAFLSKFDTDGNFRWARTFGGSGNDEAYDIGINQAGNILITGKFSNSVDFDPGDGTNIQQSSGGFDMYISAFDPDGNYLWTETWGGSGTITSLPGMAFDDSGNLYVSANFSSEFDFDPGPDVFNVSSNGSTDIFLVKFDQSMNLEWVHTFGSSAADGSSGAFYQSPDSVFITGTFSNTVDFDPGPGNGSISSVGGQDSYVARYDLDGAFQWARGWGGSQTSPVQDVGHGVAFDSQGNVYVSGMFMGPECDFDPGPDEDIRPNMGVRDVYLVKFDLEGNYLQAQTWGSDKYDSGWKIAVDSHDNLFQVGYLAGTADMAANDPPCSEIASVHESNGDWDLFLIKYLADGCW